MTKISIKDLLLKEPDKYKYWILIALVFKGILFVFNLSIFDPTYGFIKQFTYGDFLPFYIDPIDNFIKNGIYEPDYRMPGYGFVYILLHFLPKFFSLNVIIFLQFILDAITTYLLAKTIQIIFNSKRLFYLTFFAYLISTYVSLYNNHLSPESFTCSAIILSLYFFTKVFYQRYSNINLFLSGIFFTWVIFMRPVYAPIILAFVLILLIKYWKTKKTLITSVFYFLVSFAVLDSAWTVRNYYKYNKILPLMTSVHYKGIEESYFADLIIFLSSWGGDFIYWNPSAEIRWFGIYEKNYEKRLNLSKQKAEMPNYIYTSAFNKDSLLILKKYIALLSSDTCSNNSKVIYDSYLKTKFKEYTASVKNEKPFLFYVESRFILFKKFVIHSGTYNLFDKPFNDLNLFEKLVKLFYTSIYLFVLIVGFLYALFLLLRFSFDIKWLIGISAIYSVTVFPIGLKMIEYRYLVPAYVFLLFCAVLAIFSFITFINGRRNTKSI